MRRSITSRFVSVEPRTRQDKLLSAINPEMRLLELGPSFAPIAAKREGWGVYVVDHLDRPSLIAKYRSHPGVDVSRIEDVDIVWHECSLHEAVPEALLGTFDGCIASHVLEHLPDPLGLFKSLEGILRSTGIVSLAIPDKRYCFDFFKPLSSVGELLEANRRRATRHSRKSRFDFEAYNVTSDGAIAWDQSPLGEIALMSSLTDAKRIFEAEEATDADPYIDCHAWHFTPSSFELAILDLGVLNELDFHVERSFPTDGCEFFVTLCRGKRIPTDQAALQTRRLELLTRTLGELREQADLVIPSTPRSGAGDARSVRKRVAAFGARVLGSTGAY